MRRRPFSKILLGAVFAAGKPAPVLAQDRAEERAAMIATIEDHARTATSAPFEGAVDPAVLAAMREVPRHAFVPKERAAVAYANRPLPIGHGQTISQPFIVALMTDLLDVEAGDRVLEIGTGSGYQAAVLAEMGADVRSLEIVSELAETAAERLAALYPDVEVRQGDGYYGWAEAAPFDGIVVTAAASHVPPPLVAQLKPGGRMVIPVGSVFTVQQLMLVEKDTRGDVTTRQLLPVRFVPLTGGGG